MQSLIYLAFAALGFVIPYGISLAIGNELVQNNQLDNRPT